MITSRQNFHFKEIKQLQKKRVRDELSVFLVEGQREIARVNPALIERLYVTNKDLFSGLPCEIIEMAPELIEELTYRGGDAIGVVKMKREKLEKLSLFVAADGVEKPGNLGAMMRTADGAGFEGIVSVGGGVDLYSPNVIRASLGAFFTRKVVETNAKDLIDYCNKNGISLFAASPEATQSIYQTKFPQKMCVVIGSEAFGICEEIKKASTLFSLPMLGEIDSLNAATAFGIIAYEVVRQRHFT